MLAKDMLEFRKHLEAQGILFCYSGYMTEDILLGIGNALKKKMDIQDLDAKKKRAIFSIFVEQMQNVIRYSAEREMHKETTELSYGLLTVGEARGKVYVTCCNVVNAADAERLKITLSRVKGLDKDGLKALWKETLKGDTPEFSKGAGVGFIDIARLATGGIDYDFAPLEDGLLFFTIKAYI